MRRFGIATLTALALTAALAVPVFAGPQPLPMAACSNSGVWIAHGSIPEWLVTPHERVPHLHTFGGVEGCYHFNPTVPAP